MCEEGEDDEFFDALDSVDDIEKRWDRLMVCEKCNSSLKCIKMQAELEGQIEKSGELKTTGNGHFSTGEFDLAVNCYEQALSLLPTHDICKELADERKKKGKESAFDSGTDEPAAHARAVLHGNLAATQKHLDQNEDAIKNATEALRLEVHAEFFSLEQSGNSKSGPTHVFMVILADLSESAHSASRVVRIG